MKGLSPTTGLEINIEPFIIELDSPGSTPPPNPTKDSNPRRYLSEPVIWKSPLAAISLGSPSSPATGGSVSDFWSESNDVRLLDFLFSPIPIPIAPSPSLFEILVRDPSPLARAAVLYYLPFSPVVQRDASALIPALPDDEEVMVSLATNIAYYHAQNYISEWELEYLLMVILSCRNREGVYRDGVDMKVVQFYDFALWQNQCYRQYYVPRSKQDEHVHNQKELRDNTKRREKSWKCKRAAVQRNLDLDRHMQYDLPLPYGCDTLADVYTDVNETYTSSSVAALPVNWAQSVPHSNKSRGIYVTLPIGNLPSSVTDMCSPHTAGLAALGFLREDRWFSGIRASLGPPCHSAKKGLVNITAKLPKSNKHAMSKS